MYRSVVAACLWRWAVTDDSGTQTNDRYDGEYREGYKALDIGNRTRNPGDRRPWEDISRKMHNDPLSNNRKNLLFTIHCLYHFRTVNITTEFRYGAHVCCNCCFFSLLGRCMCLASLDGLVVLSAVVFYETLLWTNKIMMMKMMMMMLQILAFFGWQQSLSGHVPSVLWHCWLGHLIRKNPSPIWPIMCMVGR